MSNLHRVEIFDTTLRDGGQTAGINFSTEDKQRIADQLAEFGIPWIEGGWPGASPKDDAFFENMRQRHDNPLWKSSKLVAFGCTARPGNAAEHDPGLAKLVASGADAACIFGKASVLHVTKALGIQKAENIELVRDSISFLKQHFDAVFFDAEHFFDGYNDDAEYAVEVLQAAAQGGADTLVLCDTNGGNIPYRIAEVVTRMLELFPGIAIGIHAHNDCELAVANSLAAARVGARQIQGTINGIGERCGNANLISIIADLQLKMGIDCGITTEKLQQLGSISRFVNEMANRLPWKHQPFVGLNAFTHKGGIHVSAIRKESRLYEHVSPELVGNRQRILLSDQAGKSNVIVKLKEMELDHGLQPDDPAIVKAVEQVKRLESLGYTFEAAEASFQLLLLKATGRFKHYFELESFRVIDEKHGHEGKAYSEATLRVTVGSKTAHTAALGNGPINAIDSALRKALIDFYPNLSSFQLSDFKVRVLTTKEGTRAKVRVLIESTDGKRKWSTVGVSTNMIEAGYQALMDSIEYKLLLDQTPFPEL